MSLETQRQSDKVRIQQYQTLLEISEAIASNRDLASLFRNLAQHLRAMVDEELIGASQSFKRILKQVETVAPTDSTVLIRGETGTGKELIARAIHSLSGRNERTLVKINCAAIPTGLLESELFGHEKGAFTGAIAQRVGRFELAHKGTLFLDEVGDIPFELQPKLPLQLVIFGFALNPEVTNLRLGVVDESRTAASREVISAFVESRSFRVAGQY